ncbi:hypothetical protein ACIBCC_07640 [Streptomyces griseus]|uniref:hypothetical protein n=1 Tax=Streptomyces griseus TaxID=1911 RepID=UPI0033A65427
MSALTSAAGRAAGTLAVRALQRDGRIRLGGREERRIVYGHFQLCAFRVFDAADDVARSFRWYRVTTLWIGGYFAARRALVGLREMEEAFAELALVGNAKPVAAAVDLFNAAIGLDLKYSADHKKNAGARKAYLDAQAAFVKAAREDLWYLPQWWQVWRPAWWGARWRSLRGQRKAKRDLKSGT